MAGPDGDDDRLAGLKAEAVDLTRRLAEVPALAARRREVVRELVDATSARETAELLGVSRQAVYQIIAD